MAMNLFMGGINMVYGETVAVVYDMPHPSFLVPFTSARCA
jgi:hypothetical protein